MWATDHRREKLRRSQCAMVSKRKEVSVQKPASLEMIIDLRTEPNWIDSLLSLPNQPDFPACFIPDSALHSPRILLRPSLLPSISLFLYSPPFFPATPCIFLSRHLLWHDKFVAQFLQSSMGAVCCRPQVCPHFPFRRPAF